MEATLEWVKEYMRDEEAVMADADIRNFVDGVEQLGSNCGGGLWGSRQGFLKDAAASGYMCSGE